MYRHYRQGQTTHHRDALAKLETQKTQTSSLASPFNNITFCLPTASSSAARRTPVLPDLDQSGSDNHNCEKDNFAVSATTQSASCMWTHDDTTLQQYLSPSFDLYSSSLLGRSDVSETALKSDQTGVQGLDLHADSYQSHKTTGLRNVKVI